MSKEQVLKTLGLTEANLTEEQKKLVESMIPVEPLSTPITVYVRKSEYEALKAKVEVMNEDKEKSEKTSVSKLIRECCAELWGTN